MGDLLAPSQGGLAERPGGRSPLSSGSVRGLGRIATPQRPLGTFRRWKVPRRRLLQKRSRRRAGIRFAYLVRTVLCQSERDIFQNPLFQPHIFFSSRRKENVPLTVQKKRRPGEPLRDGSPSPGPPAERLSDGYLEISLTVKRDSPLFRGGQHTFLSHKQIGH